MTTNQEIRNHNINKQINKNKLQEKNTIQRQINKNKQRQQAYLYLLTYKENAKTNYKKGFEMVPCIFFIPL